MSEELRQKLSEDLLSEAPWEALELHWQKGSLLAVRGEDLLEVAVAFASDDSARVRGWLELGVVARVAPEEAARWRASRESFDAVIVQPWVLLAVGADA